MKKILLVILSFILSLSLFGCDSKKEDTKFESQVEVVVPNGLPFMAISNLIGYENVEVKNVTGTEIPAELTKGEAQIVIAPINAGAKLVSTGKANYKLATPITFNNAFLATSKETEKKILTKSDLDGITVHAFNKSGIPGSVLNYLFTSFDSSNVDYTLTSSADIYGAYKDSNLLNKFILICEPELSKLNKENITTYDLKNLFGRNIPQAAIFVNNNFAKSEANKVLNLIEENIKYLNSNPKDFASKVVSKHKLFETWGSELIEKLIPNAGIKYELNKEDVSSVLTLLNVTTFKDEHYYQK